MTPPLIAAVIFLAGLIGLVCSSHYFVGGSASLAKHLGMRPGLIGLTVVAFGTSAPEIVVSAGAALEGAPDLGVGNAIGSNIANIGLVLAVTTFVARLPVTRGLIWIEVPLLAVATGLAALFLLDAELQRYEGFILLAAAAALPFMLMLDQKIHRVKAEADTTGACAEDIPDLSLGKSLSWLLGGLIVLLISADLLVESATTLAEFFGVSPLIIGLTIVALGTSLPELAASIASALKGHLELAVGNIIGSNVLNILAVMSLPALLMPTTLEANILYRDTSTMALLTVLLIAAILFKTRKSRSGTGFIGVPMGVLFFAVYILYYIIIVMKHTTL